MDDIVKSGFANATSPTATEEAPSTSNVLDEWGRLESRVRFYRAGAESIASDWINPVEIDPLLRGGDDLIDQVMASEEILKAHFAAVKSGADEERAQ